MTRKAARVAFSGPRVTSLTVAGARIFFPDRMALTADPSAPRRRCTARIRWRDDTSAPGYAIIVGARPEWCVPVLPSPPSRARSFHLAAGARVTGYAADEALLRASLPGGFALESAAAFACEPPPDCPYLAPGTGDALVVPVVFLTQSNA